jgi:branched-chain amino acid transport system substrate-binding protein
MKNKGVVVFGILLAIVAALVVVGVATKDRISSSENGFKIGAALALTGDAAAWGAQERNGIELALDDLAKENIHVIYEDTFSSSKGSFSAVQKLMSVDGAKYIIGPTWLDSYPGAQSLIKGTDVTMVTPSANASTIQQPENLPNLYSLWYRTEHDADMFTKILKNSGKKSVAILALNDSYFTTFMELLKPRLENAGIKVVSIEYVNYGSDPKAALQKQYGLKPEAIMIASYDPAIANKAYQYVNQRFDASIMKLGTNIKEYLAVEGNGANLVNDYYYIKPKAVSDAFLKKYEARFGSKPDFSASQAYDSVMLIANTYKTGKAPTTLETASYGTITFDSVHGITSSKQLYDVYRIVDGKEVLQ